MLGSLINYVLGAYLRWDTMAYINAVVLLLYLPPIWYSPESPSWLLRHNRVDEARQALQYLRGKEADISEEFRELEGNLYEIFSDQTTSRAFLLDFPLSGPELDFF